MTTPPPTPPAAAPQAPLSPSDEKLWATLIHISGILVYFVGPLIGYLVLKDRGPFIREHSRQALNFQLTLFIGFLVGWITAFIIIGFIILAIAGIVSIIFSIIAAIAANKGENYKYPFAIQFVK
jgi:uncharacterized protein